jgi:hypothetical protein
MKMAPALKLTKQMQYVILGVILACFSVFALINFIMIPIITTWKANVRKTQEIETKLADEHVVVKTRQDVQQQVEEAQERIRRLADDIPLPVLGNFLLGMEEKINTCAKDLDVQITQVANQDILNLGNTGFMIYRVRAPMRAGYQPMLSLLQNLQESNRLLSISGLTISPRADNPKKHDVSFTVSWLIWADPAKRPAFLLKKITEENTVDDNPAP